MKKLFSLLVLSLFAIGCNDGDFSVTNFNFQTQTLNKCETNSFLYKTQDQEALLLDIPLSVFKNIEARDNNNQIIPFIYTLSASDKLVYRRYNGPVSNANLCSSFPIATPTVIEEWTALPGTKIEISTYANYDSQNGGILGISGYTHHIVLRDVTFKRGENQMVLQEFSLGDYITKNLVKFNFTDAIQICQENKLLYKLNQKEALILNLDYQYLFQSVPTDGNPRTASVNLTSNSIIYKVFDNNVSGTYFCSIIPQTQPKVIEEWYAEEGQGTTGRIEVETQSVYDPITSELSGYKHYVTLKNIRFSNTNSHFFFETYYVGSLGIEL